MSAIAITTTVPNWAGPPFTGDTMVVEYIRYDVHPSRRSALLAAWSAARVELTASPHCLGVEVSQGVEAPEHLIVRIEWDSIEGHEQGFRGSALFSTFLEKVKPFIGDILEMKHYRVEGATPTLFEWMGGLPVIERVLAHFYERVRADELLKPLFAHVSHSHVEHVARFFAEVLGGPPAYSGELGGHPAMLRKHLGRAISEAQRQRFVHLLLSSCDACEVPTDPEFRSALVAYLEWATRLAVVNSQPGATVNENAPMPRWGWGVVKGPWLR